jgi:translation elongation factor EF-1alpha
MDLLRFTTAGSVDDGKSTLIGRLLLRHEGDFRRPARGRSKKPAERLGDGYG